MHQMLALRVQQVQVQQVQVQERVPAQEEEVAEVEVEVVAGVQESALGFALAAGQGVLLALELVELCSTSN